MKKTILSIFIAGLLIGCSDSAPSCSSSETEDLVLDISIPALKSRIVQSSYRISNYDYNTFMKEAFPNGKLSESVSNKKVALIIKAATDLADDATLKSIRTISTDDSLKKSECEANIYWDDRSVQISYEVQITSDGELYGTVYGL